MIYNMKLHEEKGYVTFLIRRVPGGWLYLEWDSEKDRTHMSSFVPFHDEFKGRKYMQDAKPQKESL
jgi:hypothetical protein